MFPEVLFPGGVRRCVKSDRVLRAADHYFSVLTEQGEGYQRADFAADAWPGPPENAFAWWESHAASDANQRSLAPNEVLLKLFDQWGDDPLRAESRFVLTLLLVRRKVFRVEPTITLGAEQPTPAAALLRVYCPRRDETYDVPEATPDAERAAQIQTELSQLLAA